jgi:adenine phosphoribosyltransferase
MVKELRDRIREVPDYPNAGTLFYDITTLLKDPHAFRRALDLMLDRFRDARIDIVVAMESRGFIFGAPLAYELSAGFVPIRKLGKLPSEIVARDYVLEYSTGRLEMHRDAIRPGQRVLLVDDLLATGGTMEASLEMVMELGGTPVGAVVLAELLSLGGRKRLRAYGLDVTSLVMYE